MRFSNFTLQVLYNLHKALGDTRSKDEFISSGEFQQHWCPAHSQEFIKDYCGKTETQKTVADVHGAMKTRKVWECTNLVLIQRQIAVDVQKLSK